jgi:hypothetical protein
MQVQGLSGVQHGQDSSPQVSKRAGTQIGRNGRLVAAVALSLFGFAAAAPAAEPAKPEAVQSEALPKSESGFGPTAVGKKAAQFRAEFEKLKANTLTRSQQLQAIREQTVRNVNAYHTLVGGIRSRLQMGSTPGNPELLAQWSQAQTQLTQIDSDISTLNQLSSQVSGDAGTSAYLLENIRASYGLSGALEEDHKHLRELEDEVNQNAIVIDRALQELNAEINRQQQYVSTERTALVQLAADINSGQSFAAAPRRATTAHSIASVSPQSLADRKPLVVIRFDKPDVAYEPALYQALSRALERRPDAVFDLVAVSPEGGNPSAARQDADAVLQSMTNMGLPAERVAMGAMGSNKAATPEVHIYVR